MVENVGVLNLAANSQSFMTLSPSANQATLQVGGLTRQSNGFLTLTHTYPAAPTSNLTINAAASYTNQGVSTPLAQNTQLPFITVVEGLQVGAGIYDTTAGVILTPGGVEYVTQRSGAWDDTNPSTTPWIPTPPTGGPGINDTVVINSGHVVALNGSNRSCSAVQFNSAQSLTAPSDITGSNTLTIGSGNITVNPPIGSVNPPLGTTLGGLRGEYFDNLDFTNKLGERIDQTINQASATQSPGFGGAADTFSIRWSGWILPQYTETYIFQFNEDDGARIFINNQLVLDRFGTVGVNYSVPIALTAGKKVPIRIEYFNNGTAGTYIFSWQSPSTPFQLVPQANMFPDCPVRISAPVNFGAAANITQNTTGNLILAGTLTGSNGLVINNPLLATALGTVTLSASNNATLTGNTTVNGGTLDIESDTALAWRHADA